MPSKAEPWLPQTELTYGQIYWFIRNKSYNLNAFDKKSIAEAKYLILIEAKEASPTYKLFMKAATLATRLSERSIRTIINK